MHKNRYKPSHKMTVEFRDKLKKVFKELREKYNLIARMNFMCCQSCAAYEIRCEVDKNEKSGKKGFVFWHRQDEDDLWSHGCMYLAFGDLETLEYVENDSEDRSVEVGHTIVEVLKDHGIKTEWDCDPGKRIKVYI